MTDHPPYTDDDLRAEAARQHGELIEEGLEYGGVGEAMADRAICPESVALWGDLDGEAFSEAQEKIHGLIRGAADLSEWAVRLGADGLEPLDSSLSMQTTAGPLVHIYFAVRPDMPDDMRRALVEGLGNEIAKYLPDAD